MSRRPRTSTLTDTLFPYRALFRSRLSGDAVAQAIQLAIEYDPAPPFAGGHPSRAPAAVTEGLKTRIYDAAAARMAAALGRSEEHTSELQSLMRISYAVFCLKKKQNER